MVFYRSFTSLGILSATMLCCVLQAQNSYVVEYLGFADELPSLNIDAVAQDQQGLMWLASFGTGLIRYDGSRFRVINQLPESKPRLSSPYVRDVIVDSRGRLWIAHQAGIDILEPNSLEITHRIALTGRDETTKGRASCLYLAPNGDIWVTVFNKGVFRFPGGDPDRVEMIAELVGALYINQTPDGHVFCSSYVTGMYLLENGHFVPSFPRLVYDEDKISQIKPIENQYGLLTGFRMILPDESTKPYRYDLMTHRFEAGEPEDGITVHLSPDISKKMMEFASPLATAPLFNHAFRTFKDNQGIIWVAPEYGGVFKLKPKGLNFTSCPNLQGVSLRGMLEAPGGNLYIATYNGVFRYSPKLNQAKPIGENKQAIFFHLAKLQNDTLTALSESNGVCNYVLRPPWNLYKTPAINLREDPSFYASIPLDSGWLLAGNQQIFRFRPENLHYESFAELPAQPDVQSFCFRRTRDGRIWVGTTEGVFMLSKGGRSEIPLPRLDYRLGEQSRINDIFEDKKGRIWFATHTFGLLCYDPVLHHIQAYDQSSGFISNEVYKILPSHGEDLLWVSTFSGLQCIQLSNDRIYYFNESDGTSGSEFNTGSFLQSSSGLLYFGGVKGLTRFDPEQFHPVAIHPARPYITEMFIEDVYSNVITSLNLPPQDTLLQLSNSQNTLEFHFGSNDYFRPKNNTCYVKLGNIDGNWVSLSAQTSVKYYRLPPGRYTLNVKFNNNTDKTNSQVFTIYFVIDEVYYKKGWFIGLVCLAIMSMVWWTILMRRRRYKREENLRRSIAHDLHNTLGGKISSISNMLQVINRLNDTGQPFKSELNQLLDQTIKVHSTMSDVIWVLSQTQNINAGMINRMEDYADKWLKMARIQVNFEHNIANLEKAIPVTIQHEILLVYKEILGNIVKHTFSEQVDIQFVVNPDKSIDLRVRNLFSERKINVPSGGQGLSIIQEHVMRIGGALTVTALENSFEVGIHLNHPFKNWRNK